MMQRNQLEFRVLGPLGVARGGAELALGGRRQRLVLATLLLHVHEPLSAERLISEVWGDSAPDAGTGRVRTFIWQLRRLLRSEADGEDVPLRSRRGGYVLDISPDQLDSIRFIASFGAARSAAASGHHRQSLEHLEQALALWRGPAFGDLSDESAIQAEATRLDQLHLAAEELRAELLLGEGQHGQATADLETLVQAHPLHERLWAMLMTGLYRSGRQGDALRVFQDARTRLVEDLGIEPGTELRDLEQAILRQDPALDWRPRPARITSSPARVMTGEPSLPRPLTSLVGRSAERRAVAEAIDQAPLVTLVGAGGCGKTRLALAAAGDLEANFANGACFVDLAAVSNPDHVERAIATPIGVETEDNNQLDHICRRLADQDLLLVIDNCEHLVEAIADPAGQILRRCPQVRILATSREPLRVESEVVWRVDPLQHDEAVQLFVDRGGAALAGFAPTGPALATVGRICDRVDGIPLAVELAAALVGTMSLEAIHERLDDRFSLLVDGPRLISERHRTLRAMLDWSYDLLDEPSQRLFAQLGVFVGEFTMAAAEAVADDRLETDPLRVVHGMGRLVATSMVSCVAGRDGVGRYRVLETLRQYALERLDDFELATEAKRRHARYYADFAAEAEPHLHGAGAHEWLDRVRLEMNNVRSAVNWAIANDDYEIGLSLVGSLQWFLGRMVLLDEPARWLEELLESDTDLSPELRLEALTAAGVIAYSQGDFSRMRRLGEDAVGLARSLDDDHQLSRALMVQGVAADYDGDLALAERCFEEASELCARLGDRWGSGWVLTMWASASRRAGHLDRARTQLQESLECFRSLEDRHGQVQPLFNLALAAQGDGDLGAASQLATEAWTIARQLHDRQYEHATSCLLGRVELDLGHFSRARELLLSSIEDYFGAQVSTMVAIAVEGLAMLCRHCGYIDEAAALVGFTQAMRERWHISMSQQRAGEFDRWLGELRDRAGDARLAEQLERGRGLDLDEALRVAKTCTTKLR